MSQSPAVGSSSKPHIPTTSSSNFNDIFDKALKEYKKKTKQKLTAHPLAALLDKCDSPAAILAILQDQVDQFNEDRSSDERLQRWLVPTINVLQAFSETLGEGISLVFSPAKVIFVGAGVLLQTAKEVEESQDIIVDIFERIENFFRRLEVYTKVPPTPAMTNMMVKIMVEVLDILGTATKEMKQSRAKKFIKKIAGITRLEDGLKKLDKMTNEEARMANAEVMRLAYHIDKKVDGVDENVKGVGAQVKGVDEKVQGVYEKVHGVNETVREIHENVQGVDMKVEGVGEDVKAVEEKVQMVIDDGKQAAMEAQVIMQRTAYNVDGVQRRQLLQSLRNWQSPSDPSMNHNFASDRHHGGTAEWFCRGRNFDEWKVSGSLLWIHGKPGSGKSILCSSIINDIEILRKAGSAFMAYFYFDFRDVRKQSRGDLLRSLLIQLSTWSDSFCDILSRLYEECGEGARQPSETTLIHCLKEMFTLPNQCPVYLIMDALDECPTISGIPSPREQVLDFVKDLVCLHLSNLRICVTSRPEVNIRSALEGLACCSVSLQDESGQKEDITEYIKSVVHSPSDTPMKRWRDDDKYMVIQTLSERADGMFRWVYCQLEMLRNCLPQNVPHILSQLPATLDETYARVLKEIGKTNECYARRLLQCLTVAKRPLLVEELADILALDFDAKEGIPELKENWRSRDQQESVLSTCSSLISVVPRGAYLGDGIMIVQFSHFSVKEFLTSDRLATSSVDISSFHILPEPAHTVIVKACLGILLQSEDGDVEVKYRSSLFSYAAEYWADHARFENVWTHVEDGIRILFDPAKPHLEEWLQHTFVQSTEFFAGYNLDKHRGTTLYYASLCGFRDLVAQLITENPQHVADHVIRNPAPLVAALSGRHLDVAGLLYQAGADLGVRDDKNRTLLHIASEEGFVDVAKWLLDRSVRENSQRENHEAPLHLAEEYGHSEGGIIVDAADYDNDTPLHLASQRGHVEIVRELLMRGADVTAQNRSHKTPLHMASDCRFVNDYQEHADMPRRMTETVQLLVDNGADVTALDMTYSTPLHLASSSGIPEIVRILLENGAGANAQDETSLIPLHTACLRGCAESVQLLLEHGADVIAEDWNQKTPLHLASSLDDRLSSFVDRVERDGKADTVWLLIKNGADVTAQDKTGSTPLHMASSWGDAEILQLLIEHGADVTTKNEAHSTPLHLASSWKDEGRLDPDWSVAKAESVRLLIEHGADATLTNAAYSTPLHLACYHGSAETVRVLIEHGADVAAQDGDHRTPLHLASFWDDSPYQNYPKGSNLKAETVRLLIECGADVSAQDKTHSTSLHLAAVSGSPETALLLLEHGADVTARDCSNRTPLHLALSQYDGYGSPTRKQHEEKAETAQLLINHGADVTAQDESRSTPLHLASSFGVPETVRLLIEHGADIAAQDRSRRTPLHLASFANTKMVWTHADENGVMPYIELFPTDQMRNDIVRLLIDHEADIAAKDETHSTPLHLAAFRGNAETVGVLIEHGADVTAQDSGKSTPLHLASPNHDSEIWTRGSSASSDIVRSLLEHGADVMAQDERHSTPLHMASSLGIPEIVRLLIEHGADVTARDWRHRTPLHKATSWDDRPSWIYRGGSHIKANILKLLIDHGADVTAKDETQMTPLHLASSIGTAETIRILIEHGADVTAHDENLRTPLHLASSRDEGPKEKRDWERSKDKVDTVQLLIWNGADITARDDKHWTPLHLASSKGSAEAVDLLIRHGSDVNAQNENRSTPLHLAASSHLALEGTIVRLLLRYGAYVDAKDGEGRTPFEVATSEGNYWIANILSDHKARG